MLRRSLDIHAAFAAPTSHVGGIHFSSFIASQADTSPVVMWLVASICRIAHASYVLPQYCFVGFAFAVLTIVASLYALVTKLQRGTGAVGEAVVLLLRWP